MAPEESLRAEVTCERKSRGVANSDSGRCGGSFIGSRWIGPFARTCTRANTRSYVCACGAVSLKPVGTLDTNERQREAAARPGSSIQKRSAPSVICRHRCTGKLRIEGPAHAHRPLVAHVCAVRERLERWRTFDVRALVQNIYWVDYLHEESV